MSIKNTIIDRAIKYSEYLKGTDYSQNTRTKAYKGGSTDCSFMQFTSMLFGGYPMLDGNTVLDYAAAEAKADGWDIIKSSSSKFDVTKCNPVRGDMIFDSFSSNGRFLNISHVRMAYSSSQCIHTANNREKACIVKMSWNFPCTKQIMRLKDNVDFYPYKSVAKSSSKTLSCMALQANANYYCGQKLAIDGVCGTNTINAIKSLRKYFGLSAGESWSAEDWKVIYKDEAVEPTPQPQPQPVNPTNFKPDYKIITGSSIWRNVGAPVEGTPVTLQAYPTNNEPSGVFARVSDKSGKEYLVQWAGIKKKSGLTYTMLKNVDVWQNSGSAVVGAPYKLEAYPISIEGGGVYARISDAYGSQYMIEFSSLLKI